MMLNPTRWLAAACCLVGMGAANATDGIYGYTDDTGVTHLSNVPDREPYKLMLRNPDEYRVRSKPEYRLPRSGDSLPENSPFADEIVAAANTFGLEPALLHAVITVESNHNPAALSPKGAQGLMQLMPGTSQRFGVADPWHPEQNIRGGARYLSELLTLFDQDLTLALAAYNAGEKAVIRYGRHVPPYPETRSYVTRVIALYRQNSPTEIPASVRSRTVRTM
jgi:soluble lytic murein transglycosylase-like protein